MILISAFVAVGACCFAGCATHGDEVAVESVTLDPTQKTLSVGDTFSINVTVSPSDATNKNVTWSSSDEETATVKDGVVTAVGIGNATITATAGDKHGTCAIRVNGETELTLEVGENFGDKTVNGMPIVYPNLKGISTNGEDITDRIVMTSDKKGTFDKETETYTPAEEGTHTLTFTLNDTVDSTKSVSQTVEISVYRKLMADDFGGFHTEEYAPDEKQVAYTVDRGMTAGSFFMEPSTLYYAEGTFDVVRANLWAGMAHYPSGGQVNGQSRWIRSFVVTNNSRAYIDDNINWGSSNFADIGDITQRDFVKIGAKFKLAVARVDTAFFMFVNDKYVGGYINSDYADIPTSPGLYFNSYSAQTELSNKGRWAVDGITFVGGEQAAAKIQTLLGNGEELSYVPYCPSKQYWGDSLNKDNFETGYSQDDGVFIEFKNNTCHINGGIFSDYVYYEKDFTVSFVYKPTESNYDSAGGGDSSRAWLDLRSSDNKEILYLGLINCPADAQEYENDRYGAHATFSYNNGTGDSVNQFDEPSLENFDLSDGVRYTVSRKIVDGCAKYYLKAESVKDPTQKIERNLELKYSWACGIVFAQWHNVGISGMYTEITRSSVACF